MTLASEVSWSGGTGSPVQLRSADAAGEQQPLVMAASQCQEGDAERKATAELSRHCHELSGLLSLWREGHADLHGALWELLKIAQQTSGQGGKLSEVCESSGTAGAEAEDEAAEAQSGAAGPQRLGDRFREPQGEGCPEFTSLAIQLGPAPRRGSGELDAAGSEYVVSRGGGDSPRHSDGGSSESFDLEVDEEWTRRMHDMEGKRRDSDKYYEDDDEDDDNNPVIYSPLFFENFLQSRLMARVAIGEGLRALIDQSWCQILCRVDEVEDEEGEQPDVPEQESHDSSGESSRDSSMERLWATVRSSSGGRRCPASYRMRGPMGPKEDGPLSKLMDQELLESE